MEQDYLFLVEEEVSGFFVKKYKNIVALDAFDASAISTAIEKEFRTYRKGGDFRFTVLPAYFESRSDEFFNGPFTSKNSIVNALKTAKMNIMRNRPFFSVVSRADNERWVETKSKQWDVEEFVDESLGEKFPVLICEEIDVRIDLGGIDLDPLASAPDLLDDFVCAKIREEIASQQRRDQQKALERMSVGHAATSMWHRVVESDGNVSRLVMDPNGCYSYSVWELQWDNFPDISEELFPLLTERLDKIDMGQDSDLVEHLHHFGNLLYVEHNGKFAFGRTINYIQGDGTSNNVRVGTEGKIANLLDAPASWNALDIYFNWNARKVVGVKKALGLLQCGARGRARRYVILQLCPFPGFRWLDYRETGFPALVKSSELEIRKWQHDYCNSVWYLFEEA